MVHNIIHCTLRNREKRIKKKKKHNSSRYVHFKPLLNKGLSLGLLPEAALLSGTVTGQWVRIGRCGGKKQGKQGMMVVAVTRKEEGF